MVTCDARRPFHGYGAEPRVLNSQAWRARGKLLSYYSVLYRMPWLDRKLVPRRVEALVGKRVVQVVAGVSHTVALAARPQVLSV